MTKNLYTYKCYWNLDFCVCFDTFFTYSQFFLVFSGNKKFQLFKVRANRTTEKRFPLKVGYHNPKEFVHNKMAGYIGNRRASL